MSQFQSYAQIQRFEKRQGRKATLRRLVQRHVTAHDGSLPRDPSAPRSLIEVSVGRQDSRLERMPGRETLTKQLAENCGYAAEGLQALLGALDANQILRVSSNQSVSITRLIRGASELIYGYVPRFVSGKDLETLFDGPMQWANGTYHPGGALARTLSTNWRRDDIAALSPANSEGKTRLPIIGRIGSGWRIYRGAWLVVQASDEWLSANTGLLKRIVSTLAFDGFNSGGHPFRVPCPSDFRIILVTNRDGQTNPPVCPSLNLDGWALVPYRSQTLPMSS